MSIRMFCTWESEHEIEPLPDMDEAEFKRKLEDGEDKALQHALDQCYSSPSELRDWRFQA